MSFQIVLEELEELFNQEKFHLKFLGHVLISESIKLKLEYVEKKLDHDACIKFKDMPFMTEAMTHCFNISGSIPKSVEEIREWYHQPIKAAKVVFNDEDMQKLFLSIKKIFVLQKIEDLKNDQ